MDAFELLPVFFSMAIVIKGGNGKESAKYLERGRNVCTIEGEWKSYRSRKENEQGKEGSLNKKGEQKAAV